MSEDFKLFNSNVGNDIKDRKQFLSDVKIVLKSSLCEVIIYPMKDSFKIYLYYK